MSLSASAYGLWSVPLVYFANCLLGLLAGISLSRALSSISWIKVLGRQTLPVYIAHTPIVLVLAFATWSVYGDPSPGAWGGVLVPLRRPSPSSCRWRLHRAVSRSRVTWLYEPPRGTAGSRRDRCRCEAVVARGSAAHRTDSTSVAAERVADVRRGGAIHTFKAVHSPGKSNFRLCLILIRSLPGFWLWCRRRHRGPPPTCVLYVPILNPCRELRASLTDALALAYPPGVVMTTTTSQRLRPRRILTLGSPRRSLPRSRGGTAPRADAEVVPTQAVAADTFSRSVTGGWGTASSGGVWATSSTSASSVNAGSARVSLTGARASSTHFPLAWRMPGQP